MTAPEQLWRQAAATVQRLPESLRTSPLTRREVLAVLRCGEAGLAELVEAGWATGTDDGGSPVFDRFDVLNVGLYSRTGRSLPEIGSLFVRHLGLVPEAELVSPRRWTAKVSASYTACDTCRRGPCLVEYGEVAAAANVLASEKWRVNHSPKAPGETGSPLRRVELTGQATLAGSVAEVRNPDVLDAYRTLVADYTYQFLPRAAYAAMDVVEELRLVDCLAAATLLSRWLDERGLENVIRYGLLMGPVGSGTHAWVEVVDDDGEPKVLDPTLVMLAEAAPDSALARLACGSSLNVVLPLERVFGVDEVIAHQCGCCEPEITTNVSAREAPAES